jgi:hypothetical protein
MYSTCSESQGGNAAAPAPSPPPPLTADVLDAIQPALEDLFQEHTVVTLRDVRVWLQAYSAKPKARIGALQPDETLADLLVGGGSIVAVLCVPIAFSRPLFLLTLSMRGLARPNDEGPQQVAIVVETC